MANICRTTTPSGAPVLSIARLLSSVMPMEHVPHDAAAASGSPPVRRRASARRSRAVTRALLALLGHGQKLSEPADHAELPAVPHHGSAQLASAELAQFLAGE